MDLHMVKEIYYHISFFFVYHMSQPDGWQHQGAAKREVGNRVLKCDVIKMKFLKLWDLSGYSERTMSKRPTCQKWAFGGKLSLRS